MTCTQFRDSVHCYLDGELAPAAMAAAERHRRECPSCERLAAHLAEIQAAVKRAGADAAPPPGLEARIRQALQPRWRRTLHVATSGGRGWVAAGLLLALVLTGAWRTMPSPAGAADTMDRLATRLDDSREVVLEGTILCRDCELEHRHGIKAPCARIGHHGAIATADGRIWNIIEHDSAAELIHNEALLGRRVLVHGRLFRGARALVIDRYELQG